MKFTISTAAILANAILANAHMEMSNPPPLRSKYNQYSTSIDYDMNSPLSADGSNFPCKGYHTLLGTSQGRSVATWKAGETQKFTIVGSATHNGGSCQASLSYDQGKTWTVIHSYIGNCPLQSDWELTVPVDTPSGDALFAWSWFNQVGNREMYMNCASITIEGNAAARKARRAAADAFSSRPDMFVANVANNCGTIEGKDVEFPNPGPNVDVLTSNTLAPVGAGCQQPGGSRPPTASSTTKSSSSSTSAASSTTSSSASSKTSTTTTTTTSAAPSSSPNNGVAKVWEQCGGQGWTGPTTCDTGLVCDSQGQWYSQCVPGTAPSSTTTTTSAAPSKTTSTTSSTTTTTTTTTTSATPSPTPSQGAGVAKAWAQCGGKGWTGPTTCETGLVCNSQGEWYSQCVPAGQVWQ